MSEHGEYLGETVVKASKTKFKHYKKVHWAMYFIENYGQIDGEHHKTWVLDTVARILKGNKVVITLAKWEDGHSEYRINLNDETTQKYKDWREWMKGDIDSEGDTYSYDEGCPP